MSDVSKTEEEAHQTKELVKKMNVDAVANVLLKMQNENYKVRSEFIDLKRIISSVTQDIEGLRSQLNILKAVGGRGTIGGTGSTVHKQGE
jgi:hypothetical protein